MKRPAPIDQDTPDNVKKRSKLKANSSSRVFQGGEKFASAEAVRSLLKTQNTDLLTQGLTNLRNQLTVKYNEPPITPQDERLLLVQRWLGDTASVKDIFELWGTANPKNATLQSLIVSLLSSILSLASSHLTYHAIGYPIIKTLLTPTHTRRLNTYLGGSNKELILVSLKLNNSISTFAGGRERKLVLENFPWEMKSLPKFLNMRRKDKSNENDPFAKPDIRTLYVSFLLSFIQSDSSLQVKTTFLEQHRDAFLAMFKGLHQDAYGLVRRVLELSWSGMWSDLRVKKTLKIFLFNETAIGHLMRLYGRSTAEDDDPEHVPADLVHHFLLAICSRPGIGICFRDRGWYPREQGVDESVTNDAPDASLSRGSKIYNKMLSNVLKTLKVNEDPRQQELAIKIMTACPELVAGYWPAAALTLEPRLSSRWLANIAFFGTIISLPVPTASFLLNEDSLGGSYQPTPPPLNTILENILPSVNIKNNFTKGLQSTSSLVQHCSALALIKCLIKYDSVIQTLREVATSLEEDEEDGQWSKRIRDLEKEIRRRVPEFQVIVAFSQHVSSHNVAASSTQNGVQKSTATMMRTALLAESAQRLLWMYHRTLPVLTAEARFDVAKLLHGFSTEPSNADEEEEEEEEIPDAVKRLDRVRRLHVVRLLKESDQFSWSGKPIGSSHSYLHVLLMSFIRSENVAERTALADLLHHILSQTTLFQEDTDEPSLWLSSLPVTRRTSGSISPDGAALTDEAESVITFLDDCVQRGMKTPYRYIEELQVLAKTMNASTTAPVADLLGAYPSPLLMTVIEQLDAKVGHKLLSPSDLLALVSFVRRLVCNLSTKALDLGLLHSIAQRIDEILSEDRLFLEYAVVSAAIRREVKVLRAALSRLRREDSHQADEPGPVSEQVAEFLTEVAQLSPPSSGPARLYTAYELVDWLRLIDESIGPEEVNCVIDVVKDFYPEAISNVVDHLDVCTHSVWDVIDVEEYSTKFPGCFSAQQLYLHADESVLSDLASRKVISQALFSSSPTLLDIKRMIRLISHGLGSSSSQDQYSHTLLLLLAMIVEDAGHELSDSDLDALKEELFLRQGNLKTLCVTEGVSAIMREGLKQFVQSTLYPVTESNRALVTDICAYWVNVIKSSLEPGETEVETAAIWVHYFTLSDLVDLFDQLARAADELPSPLHIDLLNSVLSAIKANPDLSSDIGDKLRRRLPTLLALRGILQDYAALDDLLAAATSDTLPLHSSPIDADGSANLSSAIQNSERCWLRAKEPLSHLISPQQFLEQGTWTRSTVHILRGLSYRRAIDQDTFASWLRTSHFNMRTVEEYIPVLHAFLDCMHADGGEIMLHNFDAFEDAFQRASQAVITKDFPSEQRVAAASCATLLLNLIPPKSSHFVSQVLRLVKSSNSSSYTVELLSLAISFHGKVHNDDSRQLVTMLVETQLQRFVRLIGDPDQHVNGLKSEVERFASLVKVAQDVKAQYVETLLGVVIQNHLGEPEFVKLVTLTLQATRLKPLIVNRHLQSILQHPQFNRLCTNVGNNRARDAIVELLFALFNLHPSNTCQVTHIQPLIGIYRATLSSSDMKLFSIFQLFEQEKKLSVNTLLSQWSAKLGSVSSSFLEAVHSLDPSIMFRTSLHYPQWRRLEDQSRHTVLDYDAQLYDPVFMILLFGTMLSESLPSSVFAWVEMFRTNIVGLLVRSLSNKDARVRDLALCNLSALWKSLQTANLIEGPHVLYTLSLLKNVYAQPSSDAPRRLPSYTTLILLHALRGVFYPSNFTYPLTARFLLQRPELDTADVPMLYSMLYSSSDDWKKERIWILRMLADGMMSSEDWRVLKRRHTWDLLASLFQSSHGDYSLRRGTLEVLASLTSNPRASLSLILKSSLLTWIHMQLLGPNIKEDLSWAKILSNVVFLVDVGKLEVATNGEWRNVICQCLSILLNHNRCSNALALLAVVSPTVLKLSSTQSSKTPAALSALLDSALGALAMIEVTLDVPVEAEVAPCDLTLPPHSAVSLHDPAQEDSLPISVWGRSVEMLWQTAMNLDSKPISWDALTIRILLWRSIVGAEKSVVGEWARTSVVRSIASVQ
ncbi:hypothetical protein M378DRAFT_162474 [Amanita muscaria Koide BX008]|uniref:Nucleolar pre-ribosomal-associated protein 1 n=1 Tax=Amanita muscaria (strain Koide BX008) TaxID=946122 RepID=A0A0C2X8W5_AMAMK|nr:hypothetical protein M378DRAFT_162474 [Amanita muscaria Koide BX008]